MDWLTEFQLQDTLNPDDERGQSLHVPEHKATLSAVYTTTVGEYPWWARDWTFGLIADYAAGRPFNILAGVDRNGNSDPLSDRPVGVDRNSGELPDYFVVDARVARRIPIGPVGLEAIFEVFNLFNSKNLLAPQTTNLVFDFSGTIRSGLGDPRQAQVGLRLLW